MIRAVPIGWSNNGLLLGIEVQCALSLPRVLIGCRMRQCGRAKYERDL